MPKVLLSKIDPDDRHNRPDVSKDAHQHFLRIASRAVHGLSQLSNFLSRRSNISFLIALISVNWSQRVRSHFWGGPSISTINSSTSPSLSGYFLEEMQFAKIRGLFLPVLGDP